MDLGLALVNLSKHLDFDEKALNSKRMFKPTPFCIMLLHKRLKPQLRDVINELPPYLICHVRVDNEVHLFFCNFIQVNSSNRLEGAWLWQIFLGGIPIVSWLKKQKNCTNILIKKRVPGYHHFCQFIRPNQPLKTWTKYYTTLRDPHDPKNRTIRIEIEKGHRQVCNFFKN